MNSGESGTARTARSLAVDPRLKFSLNGGLFGLAGLFFYFILFFFFVGDKSTLRCELPRANSYWGTKLDLLPLLDR